MTSPPPLTRAELMWMAAGYIVVAGMLMLAVFGPWIAALVQANRL